MKPVKPRVRFNGAMVKPETLRLLKKLAAEDNTSQGRVIDRAVAVLAGSGDKLARRKQ